MTKKTHEGFSFNFQAMGLFMAAGIFGTITFLFLLLALQSYAETLYGEPVSWLVTAAVTAVIALAIYLSASYSKRKKAIIHRMKEQVEDRLTPVAHIIQQLAEPVKDHPLAAVALAALAGLMAGDKLNSNDHDEE